MIRLDFKGFFHKFKGFFNKAETKQIPKAFTPKKPPVSARPIIPQPIEDKGFRLNSFFHSNYRYRRNLGRWGKEDALSLAEKKRQRRRERNLHWLARMRGEI